ncbi:glycoside hydrolase family 13 [Lecanosticta acicola]|uniref:alpha-amylase n=1 Tax=Lecanosticta acicola TaxID=111012 RepID=A0AAI9EEC3_9PEZI|nr:glycoside hydrolase family 13 [Lecanosticta acicola]
MHFASILTVLSLALCRAANAATSDDWRSKTIYQVLTDRFARTDGSTTAACDTSQGIYCNGTWQGLIDQLDYIQGMGFDAVWISPITKQLEGNTADGSAYHGYWQQDINAVNEHFGTASDLTNLASELHSRSMLLMIDVVTNHYAYSGSPDTIDYSIFVPFNDESYFHPYCAIDYSDDTNTTNIEQCWEGDTTVPLPDLKTEAQNVSAVWDTWVGELVSNYSVDGLRIDSLMEVNTGFWSGFQSAAGVYSVGEVLEGDEGFVCAFQDYVPGVMNYPMYFPLVAAFESTTGSIYDLADMIDTIKSCPDTSLLGTFSENHDQPRFASLNGDIAAAKNVLAFTMLTDGIPIVYQGQEQHYNAEGGSSTPYNREALWLSGYNTDAVLYQLVTTLNAIRHHAIADDSSYTTTQNSHVYNDYTNIAMKKGSVFTVLSNVGSSGSNYTLDIPSGYDADTELTELLSCDTLTVDSSGNATVPMSAGLPRVYYPTSSISGSGLCGASSKRSTTTRNLKPSRHFRFADE